MYICLAQEILQQNSSFNGLLHAFSGHNKSEKHLSCSTIFVTNVGWPICYWILWGNNIIKGSKAKVSSLCNWRYIACLLINLPSSWSLLTGVICFSTGLKDAYIFNLNSQESIDATRKGSLARFINHSW